MTTFTATVTDVDKRGAHIWIADPLVRARVHSDPAPAPGIGREGAAGAGRPDIAFTAICSRLTRLCTPAQVIP